MSRCITPTINVWHSTCRNHFNAFSFDDALSQIYRVKPWLRVYMKLHKIYVLESKEFWRPLDNEAEDKLNKLKNDLDLDINSSSHSINKVILYNGGTPQTALKMKISPPNFFFFFFCRRFLWSFFLQKISLVLFYAEDFLGPFTNFNFTKKLLVITWQGNFDRCFD